MDGAAVERPMTAVRVSAVLSVIVTLLIIVAAVSSFCICMVVCCRGKMFRSISVRFGWSCWRFVNFLANDTHEDTILD